MSANLVVSIETIPDVPRIRQLFGLGATLSEADVADYAFQRQRADGGKDKLPFHLQRILLISCFLRDSSRAEFITFDSCSGEACLLQEFASFLKKEAFQIVGWEVKRFVRPLVLCRAMLLGVDTELPSISRVFRSRQGATFCDLAQELSFGLVPESRSVLADFAALASIPSYPDSDALIAWQAWMTGGSASLRAGCERRVLMTYLVLLRLQQALGLTTGTQREEEERFLRTLLEGLDADGPKGFLRDWKVS